MVTPARENFRINQNYIYQLNMKDSPLPDFDYQAGLSKYTVFYIGDFKKV
jgi:hypothetical protein